MGTEFLAARDGMMLAQREWATQLLRVRLAVIRRLRKRMAAAARELAETIPTRLPGALSRTVADSLVSEVLPLIEACRFLEREAENLLRTRTLEAEGRPVWLSGVEADVERAPWGLVLVLAAGNYPLLLAGVQTIQALVAGNAVLWKPAPGTEDVAFALRGLLVESGLNSELLTVLDASVEAATEAIAAGVDHVVLTGSAETGKAVLRQLAETLTPATMELSGCDAVFVLPGADFGHTIQALQFGLRFNGSFTCMAPRRVFLVGLAEARAAEFEVGLVQALKRIAPVAVPAKTHVRLGEMLADAREQGGEILLNGLGDGDGVGVTLIAWATPAMLAMQTDVFAPVLSVMRTADVGEALAASAACPYALTASVFGPEKDVRLLAGHLRVGNVLINDVVVPTADPRIAFGGRGRSGFGVTRGAEGLLAMTVPKTIQRQRKFSKHAFAPTGAGHVEFFAAFALMLHGGGLWRRWSGLMRLLRAARALK
jgi:acyl-CoA reductase-like NAD-dependent aldehyde dehydrogenase